MKLNKLAGATIAIVLLAGVGLSGTLALADTAPAAAPTPPVGLSVAELSDQSQRNISMAQMLFKLGQMQGELASLKQQQEAGALVAKKVADQLKTAQDGLRASQAQLAERSKPRCDGVSYLLHYAPDHQLEQNSAVPAPKKK